MELILFVLAIVIWANLMKQATSVIQLVVYTVGMISLLGFIINILEGIKELIK